MAKNLGEESPWGRREVRAAMLGLGRGAELGDRAERGSSSCLYLHAELTAALFLPRNKITSWWGEGGRVVYLGKVRGTQGASWHHPGERRSVAPEQAKEAPILLLAPTPPSSPTFQGG